MALVGLTSAVDKVVVADVYKDLVANCERAQGHVARVGPRVKVKVTVEMSARESVQYPGEASQCATFI